MEWKPISTAPRDGSFILVYPVLNTNWAGDEYRLVVQAWWDDNLEAWSLIGSGRLIDPAPLHWMPLPPPPSDGEGEPGW